MPVEPSAGSVGVSSVGTPEVVSIIETRPMVVGPLRDATRTVTSSVAAEASEEDEASLEEGASVDCVWLVPQAASASPAVMEPSAARAWRRVMLVLLSMGFSSHVVGATGRAPLVCGVAARAAEREAFRPAESWPRVRRGNSSMRACPPAGTQGGTTTH